MLKRDKRWSGEETLLVTRPNFFLSNKGIMIAVILLGVIFYVYTATIQFVANLTVNTINFVQWPLTEYTAIAFLVIGILIVLYILFELLSWSSYKYTITSGRIITESGVIRKDKSSMPYNTIQDVVISQGIVGRMIGIGSVLLYSAYDGKDLQLTQISNPHEVEEIIFEQLQYSKFQSQPVTPIHNNMGPENSYGSQNQEPYNQYNQQNNPYQNQYQEPVENNPYQNQYQDPESFSKDYGFSTNLYTMDDEERGYAYHDRENPDLNNIRNQQEYSHNPVDDRDFDNNIKRAMRNMDGDVKFRNNENPNLKSHNLFEELGKNKNGPHNLFDDEREEYYNEPEPQVQPNYQQSPSQFNEYKDYDYAPYLNNDDEPVEEIHNENHRNLEDSDIMKRHDLKFKKNK
ncbi:PH domain-containing protein [Methanobrevibacter acididurans]|uniref:PH domain-containing protein n=1 Tax=Methanobrevibacter acididurans TaxID=120963 RepID=UPI0038FCF18C